MKWKCNEEIGVRKKMIVAMEDHARKLERVAGRFFASGPRRR